MTYCKYLFIFTKKLKILQTNIMENLREFLNGGMDKLSIPMMPISEVSDALTECGWEMQQDWDTNGWDHDFWIYFEKGENKIMFSGSWYYGNYQLQIVQ